MKKVIYIFLALVGLASCAGKTSSTDGKKNGKPVISAFDATTEQKNSKAASDVLDSPRFVPSTPPAEVAPPVATAPVDKNSPKEVIKSYTAELQVLQEDTSTKGSKREKQISDKVRKFFDFEGLSKKSLGSNWNQLTPKRQQEFVTLLTGLIEKSYLRKSSKLVGNYRVSYGNEVVKGEEATVACEIYKEDVDLEIVYELHKNAGSWMIYNIIFDQVNLVKNYQSQFNQIIAKNKLEGLMSTMRKKLKEDNSEVDAAM
jgi:phospholipid transport system substrate-binding protein